MITYRILGAPTDGLGAAPRAGTAMAFSAVSASTRALAHQGNISITRLVRLSVANGCKTVKPP